MENKFDLIEKYLMNEMSVREQVEFEEALRENPDLMKEFLLREEINNAIIENDVVNLRQELNNIVNHQSNTRSKRTFFIYSAAAAVFLLMIVASGVFFNQGNQIENRNLFVSYYTTYPPVLSFRSSMDQNDIEKLLYEAFNLYDEKQYDSAAVYFKNVLEKDNSNNMSQFYLSVCEIEKNNLTEAEKYLNGLIQKKNHIFWEQSNWYLALVYLKQNEFDNAERVLNRIVEYNMTQKSEAELILKNLN